MESRKAVTDAKVEIADAKEALPGLEGWASVDRSALRSAIEEGDCIQSEVAMTSAKFQVAKWALTATFYHLKRRSGNVQAVEAAVQERMKPNLRN